MGTDDTVLATILSDLTRAVTSLSASTADNLRSITNIQKSIDVALDKLNSLERAAERLDEKTRRLDATHYTLTEETAKQAGMIRVEIIEVKEILEDIKTAVQGLPSGEVIKTLAGESIKAALANGCPRTEDFKKAFREVIAELAEKERLALHHHRRKTDKDPESSSLDEGKTVDADEVKLWAKIIGSRGFILLMIFLILLALAILVLAGVPFDSIKDFFRGGK